MLRLSYPPSCHNERKWIADVLLREFLAVDYVTEVKDGEVKIEAEGKKLVLPDIFFPQAEGKWLEPETLPQQPLREWDTQVLRWEINLTTPVVPVVFGDSKVEVASESIRLGLDIFGASFFMLSRYEEVVKDARDGFDRFPAAASLARQEGFLNRPIVNEYLEILWAAMKQLWPGLMRKKREGRTLVSCDVDMPYSWGTKSIPRLVRQMGGDLIRRKNPLQSFRTGLNYFYAKTGDYTLDPFYGKLEWIMDLNERAGNKVAFYFITDCTEALDGCYSIDEPIIRSFMNSVNDRGHEIGLHPSYNTYLDQRRTCAEADKLRRVMQEIGIYQDTLGSRQHFLRWSSPGTARNLEAAGMSYDSTLSFAEHAGFRCGVCYEYPLYDLVERRELSLLERPLVVMEKSMFDRNYMGYSHEVEGLEILERLKRSCCQFNGDFTVLWHNNQFPDRQAMAIYEQVIQ